MKTTQSSGTRPVHQKVAGSLEFKSGGKAIAIEFTDQQLSPHAGSATFWGWLRPLDWVHSLRTALPHGLPLSNNHLLPVEKALAFVHGLLCDARKLTHVAYLRRDPLVPEMLGIKRIASQSVLSRFFQRFTSAGENLRGFRPLWRWCVDRLPSRKEGYTLDLDSTRLLHEDGHQEGVATGYTRLGLKPCLHPLLAVIAEVRLVASRQCDLRQQRHRLLSRSVGEPATPRPPARVAGALGTTAVALRRGGPTEPADSKTPQEGYDLEGDRSAGHRGGRSPGDWC